MPPSPCEHVLPEEDAAGSCRAPASRLAVAPPPQPLEQVMLAFEELAREQAAELARQNAALRRQNLALEEANRLRGDFVAMVSHELRTPLNAVLGFSELLLEELAGPLSSEQRQYVGIIGRSGKSLLALINDMLDLAKIDAGAMAFRADAFDLREPVVEAEALAHSLVRQKEQVLVLSADAAVPCAADAERVRQIALNLISNAVKFTPAGGHIRVAVRGREGQAELEVRDSGIGIDPAHHEDIFQPYRQLGGGGGQRGTGLGLALVRRFTEAMGGTVHVDSAPGEGASFTVRLPAAPAGEAAR